MADDAIEIHPGTPNIYFAQEIVKGRTPTRSWPKQRPWCEG